MPGSPQITGPVEKLQNFPGAIILVSHDRFFVDKIAKKLFIFKGDGSIEESYKPYSEYLDDEKELKDIIELEKESNKSKSTIPTNQNKPKTIKLSYNEQKLLEINPNYSLQYENALNESNHDVYANYRIVAYIK